MLITRVIRGVMRRFLRKREKRPEDVAKEFILLFKDPDGFYIEEIPPKGRGVRTGKKIFKGEYLCTYFGKYISKERGEELEEENSTGIDASEEPNEGPLLGRLVNHGRGQEQNCTMKKVRIDNKPYLCLFAIRNIEVGEELLYNYGVDLPWETMVCGSLKDSKEKKRMESNASTAQYVMKVTEANKLEHTKANITESTDADNTELATRDRTERIKTESCEAYITESCDADITRNTEPDLMESTKADIVEINKEDIGEITEADTCIIESSRADINERLEADKAESATRDSTETEKNTESCEAEMIDITDADFMQSTKADKIKSTGADVTVHVSAKSDTRDISESKISESIRENVTMSTKWDTRDSTGSDITESIVDDMTGSTKSDTGDSTESNITESIGEDLTWNTRADTWDSTESNMTESIERDIIKSVWVDMMGSTEADKMESTDSHITDSIKTNTTESTNADKIESTEANIIASTGANSIENTEPDIMDITENNIADGTKANITESTEPDIMEITEADIADGTEANITESTEPDIMEITEADIADGTEANITESTEPDIMEITEAGITGGTEANITESTEPNIMARTKVLEADTVERTNRNTDQRKFIETSDLEDLASDNSEEYPVLSNFAYNVNVLEKGNGTLIPTKRPKKGENVEACVYSPCEYCFGFFVSSELWKHHKKCLVKPEGKTLKDKCIKARSALLLPMMAECSQELKSVLANMNDDNVTETVRKDTLILKYGEKIMKVGNEQHNKHFISQKMRELGRLLIEIKKTTPGCLRGLLKPSMFPKIIAAVKSLTGYDEKSQAYLIPSLALKLGSSLKKCAKILKAEALINGDDVVSKAADDFFDLCEMEWPDQVSTIALKNLKEKKWNKPEFLPVVQDIALLHNYLKEMASQLRKKLISPSEISTDSDEETETDGKNEEMIKKTRTGFWYQLAKVSLTQIILFNRRRSGEASRIKIDNYYAAGTEYNEDIRSVLSEVERKLLDHLNRFVIRGKRGNKVPVLLTNEMKEDIDCLMAHRKSVSISETNSYLFAIPESENHIRGSDCLRIFSEACGAEHPEIFALLNNELDVLAKFMGHNIKVHREYYRLPENTLQLAKVSKILLNLESGNLKGTGKTLEEIEVNMNAKPPQKDRKLKTIKRKSWSEVEKKAVNEELGVFVRQQRVPGKLDCDKCLRKKPELSGRSWKDIKYFIHNRIQNMKRKIREIYYYVELLFDK
ncbi:hypothetical protein KUTeg_015692, partial [Tegillarca granosa]